MLARVQRLEQGRTPGLSPLERAFGSLKGWEAECRAGISAGWLDGNDLPVVVMAVRRWHSDGVWSAH